MIMKRFYAILFILLQVQVATPLDTKNLEEAAIKLKDIVSDASSAVPQLIAGIQSARDTDGANLGGVTSGARGAVNAVLKGVNRFKSGAIADDVRNTIENVVSSIGSVAEQLFPKIVRRFRHKPRTLTVPALSTSTTTALIKTTPTTSTTPTAATSHNYENDYPADERDQSQYGKRYGHDDRNHRHRKHHRHHRHHQRHSGRRHRRPYEEVEESDYDIIATEEFVLEYDIPLVLNETLSTQNSTNATNGDINESPLPTIDNIPSSNVTSTTTANQGATTTTTYQVKVTTTIEPDLSLSAPAATPSRTPCTKLARTTAASDE